MKFGVPLQKRKLWAHFLFFIHKLLTKFLQWTGSRLIVGKELEKHEKTNLKIWNSTKDSQITMMKNYDVKKLKLINPLTPNDL
jgi:hypothetical protein